jgi:uncharacterized protein YlaI
MIVCDVCHRPDLPQYIDAKSTGIFVLWVFMCPECYERIGDPASRPHTYVWDEVHRKYFLLA